MRSLGFILLALLVACQPPAIEHPILLATTAPATRPTLQAIELHEEIYLARIDVRITVTSDGTLRSVRTTNKAYGGNDLNPRNEHIEVRQGKLTPDQMAGLARLFAGWDSLSPTPYGGLTDGPEVSVRYGQETVSGGSSLPPQVNAIRARLSELAQSMPLRDTEHQGGS